MLTQPFRTYTVKGMVMPIEPFHTSYLSKLNRESLLWDLTWPELAPLSFALVTHHIALKSSAPHFPKLCALANRNYVSWILVLLAGHRACHFVNAWFSFRNFSPIPGRKKWAFSSWATLLPRNIPENIFWLQNILFICPSFPRRLLGDLTILILPHSSKIQHSSRYTTNVQELDEHMHNKYKYPLLEPSGGGCRKTTPRWGKNVPRATRHTRSLLLLREKSGRREMEYPTRGGTRGSWPRQLHHRIRARRGLW